MTKPPGTGWWWLGERTRTYFYLGGIWIVLGARDLFFGDRPSGLGLIFDIAWIVIGVFYLVAAETSRRWNNTHLG